MVTMEVIHTGLIFNDVCPTYDGSTTVVPAEGCSHATITFNSSAETGTGGTMKDTYEMSLDEPAANGEDFFVVFLFFSQPVKAGDVGVTVQVGILLQFERWYTKLSIMKVSFSPCQLNIH